MEEKKTFFQRLVSGGTQESSKRWATITLTIAFLVTNALFQIAFSVIFIETKNFKATTIAQETINRFFVLFEVLIRLDHAIIMFGIGAIAVTTITGTLGDLLKNNPYVPTPAVAPAPIPEPAVKVAPIPTDRTATTTPAQKFFIPTLDE